jgi:hypothetical protein
MISPAEFIPVAEDIGLIVVLGRWVLREACSKAANWPDDIKVAVNLSQVQFSQRQSGSGGGVSRRGFRQGWAYLRVKQHGSCCSADQAATHRSTASDSLVAVPAWAIVA